MPQQPSTCVRLSDMPDPDNRGCSCSSSHTTPACGGAGTGDQAELSPSAFRRVEKKYKLYQLPRRQACRQTIEDTDLTEVINFRHIDRNTAYNRSLIHRVNLDDPSISCYTVAGIPGLLVFPRVLSEGEQIHWCRESILRFGDSAQHPTILSTHAKNPQATSCYQPPMRWATLGFSYQWSSKTYEREKYSTFPHDLRVRMEELMRLVALVDQCRSAGERHEVYQPQTAIVNYYPVGSMMMCHQDVSEDALSQPLVSVSLGCSAVFLMGSQSRNDAPHALLLQSGDVVAFAGPARTAFHATPRILDDCPAYLTIASEDMTKEEQEAYANGAYHAQRRPDGGFARVEKSAMVAAAQERYWRLCMRSMRVNVNVRQVYFEDCSFLYE